MVITYIHLDSLSLQASIWMLGTTTMVVSWAFLVNYTGRRTTIVGCGCYELPSFPALDCTARPEGERGSGDMEEGPISTFSDRVTMPQGKTPGTPQNV